MAGMGSEHGRPLQGIAAFFHRHQSIALGAAAGAVVFAFLTSRQFTASNVLASWIVGALIYLGMTWYRMLTTNVRRIQLRSADLDFSDSLLLILAIVAALASMGGIAVELHGLKDVTPADLVWRAGVAMSTIVISWLFLHTLFTVHYAHRYYAAPGGGLKFPENPEEPIFWDFLYFAFTIGVAAQTADVSITSMPMRRLALLHSVVSFFFNTTVLALAVNVGASLV